MQLQATYVISVDMLIMGQSLQTLRWYFLCIQMRTASDELCLEPISLSQEPASGTVPIQGEDSIIFGCGN